MGVKELFAGAALATVVAVHASPIANTVQRINSTNYAGLKNDGEGIIEVSADIIIPECTPGIPRDANAEYTSDGWVGINGFAHPNISLLQTGLTCTINNNNTGGPTTYTAWHEWAPGPPYFFASTDFRPGDVVHARVIAHNATSGTTRLVNNRTGEVLSHDYVNVPWPLKFDNVQWITEAQNYNNPWNVAVYDATYTPWRFENAKYRTKDGKSYLAGLGNPIDTYINGTKVAEGVFLKPGVLEIRDTTPANFTLTLPPFDPNEGKA